ncbi:MAG TPA: adenylate/guanylate cyclase domain-containing protein [Gaiellaceae bacterium]|nr:adenylate/guanylate cyclase domain-containing protein [Gaiellaceae bacterium]
MPACPNCGKDNPEGFSFCGYCTASLAPVPTIQEERKVVTVLFCDVVGFTRSSEDADPEDVRARMQPYYARLREEIEGYGGTVEKFIGDAVMAVFGAPVAHEDDAERAVRAGLRILEAIEDLNAGDPGLGLSVRVGVNTGEVVVNLGASLQAGEAAVHGDAVNTAARIQSAAPVDAVVVGEATYAATERTFEYEPLEPVVAKGKRATVPVWRAVAARSRFGSDMRTHDAPLVGREVERTLLRSLFERSLRDRSAQLVTVVGEPGVGKSRLVWELQTFVDDHPDLVAWRQGRCLPYGDGIAFWALGEIVKADAGILESDPPDVAAAKLERAVGLDEPDRDWLLRRVGTLVGVESSMTAEQEESFTAWRRFLEGIAAARPAVFVFEDLHWADAALLEFLRHLAEWSEGVAMTVVCTARPELLERYPDWAGGVRNATTINLSPLAPGETAELISALLDRSLLPAEVQQPIVERAGGNPLYAEEYVRMLRDRGLLLQRGATWTLAPGAELPLPESVQALVAARLDTLTAERKAVLQAAAVLGKVFWAGGVAELSGRPESEVCEALHEFSRRDLVRSSRSTTMEGEDEHFFTHIVIRDVAYAQIPRAARSQKHRAAAEWIEAKAGERAADLADVLVHHTTEALELAESAGLATEDLRERARRYLALAAERALRLDVQRAKSLLREALDLTPAPHVERAALLERLAQAAHWTSEPRVADRALEEAITIYRGAGDRAREAHARLVLAQTLSAEGAVKAQEHLRAALRMLEELGPSEALRDAYAALATERYILGDEHGAIEWADRAIDLERTAGLGQSIRARSARGGSLATLGDPSGLDDARRAIELARERDDSWELTRTLNNYALDVYPYEGPRASLVAAQEALEVAERRGVVRAQRMAAGCLFDAWIALGRWDDVEALADSLLRAGGLTDWERAFVDVSRLEVRALRGHAPGSQDAARHLVVQGRAFGEGQAITASLSILSLVAALVGDVEGARRALSELATSEETRAAWNYMIYLPHLVRSALAVGDAPLAHVLVKGATSRAPLHECVLGGAEAALAESRGELSDAEIRYAGATARWRSFGHVPEVAFAELGRARCLLALGRAGEALEPLSAAHEIFSELRAVPFVEEAARLLASTERLALDAG